MTQSEKAALLRQLHHGPSILRLCNVWDAASARIVEQAGFPAVATTSAGVAFSLGYPDLEAIPPAEMLAQVRRIARVVAVPVTADLEAGYEDIERTASGLVEAGAVGLNLEDFQNGKLVDLAAQIEKIRAVRRVGERLGVPIVINARTDIYLAQLGDAETRFERSVERLLAFKDAGADCVFVPGVYDEETIAALGESAAISAEHTGNRRVAHGGPAAGIGRSAGESGVGADARDHGVNAANCGGIARFGNV